TRLSRPRVPETSSTADAATASAAAMTAKTSRLAAPCSGRAPTRSASASPYSPATPGRDAPGRTWARSRLPPPSGRTQDSAKRRSGARRCDAQRQLVEALHDENLHELDGEHHEQWREVDAARVDERERAAHAIENRVGHGPQEPYDGIVG